MVAGVALSSGAARAQGVGTRGTTSNNSGNDGSGNNGTVNPVMHRPSANGNGGYGAGSSGGYGANQNGGYGSGQGGSSTGTGGTHSGMGPNSTSGVPDLSTSDVPLNQQQLEEQQAKARNTERQKELVAETEKLVALANELQADVAKSTKDTLSLDVIRKADEIDKLARNVREKMKNAN